MLLKTFYALIGSVIAATVIGEHGESISSLFKFVTMYIYIHILVFLFLELHG